MRRFFAIFGLTLVVLSLLAACTPAGLREPVTLLPEPGTTPPAARQVMVMVPLAPGAALATTTDAIVATFPVEVVALWPMRAIDLYCLVLEVDAAYEVAPVLARLKADPRIEIAQPLHVFETLARAGDDPMLDLQPGLRETGVLAAHGTATGRGVRVAVIDSGVDDAHPDLAGGVVDRRDLAGDGEAWPIERHGTAVAGVIAARRGNRRGIVGVAPAAELVALRACTQPAGAARGRCTSFTLARAFNAALAGDARVLNLSFGGPVDPTLTRFLAAAEAEDRVVVAALGPSEQESFPASVPTVLAVDRARPAAPPPFARAFAPGDDIVSLTPGGGYGVFAGASLATAQVSGVAALVVERAPDLSAAAIRDLLVASARRRADGALVLDACRALRAAAPADADAVCGTS